MTTTQGNVQKKISLNFDSSAFEPHYQKFTEKGEKTGAKGKKKILINFRMKNEFDQKMI